MRITALIHHEIHGLFKTDPCSNKQLSCSGGFCVLSGGTVAGLRSGPEGGRRKAGMFTAWGRAAAAHDGPKTQDQSLYLLLLKFDSSDEGLVLDFEIVTHIPPVG